MIGHRIRIICPYTLGFTVRSRIEVGEYRSRESKDRVPGDVPGGNSTTT